MLTEQEKQRLIQLIEQGRPLPAHYKNLLFAGEADYVERTAVYELQYKGKKSEPDILSRTPAAPLQKMRSFNSDNPFSDDWRNLLIFGDNLLALKALYNDQRGANRYGTKNRIKLVYIDPPFATKQDFMKDREKAYRDKVMGAQFIEFIRERLVLLREVLADDGSIYVHLDWKKGHYIKAVMDEVFGEFNFQNEIIWKRTSAHSDSKTYANVHDLILYYSRSEQTKFIPQYSQYSEEHLTTRYKHTDPDGKRFTDGDLVGTGLKGGGYEYEWKGVVKTWRCPLTTMQRYEKENRLYYTKNGVARIKRYLDEVQGVSPTDMWMDIYPVNSQAAERVDYPTQKPEQFLNRVIISSSSENDIVLDAFAGSGTTLATAEKLKRRWIGMDCGKLAIYTIQKRLLNLTSNVGSAAKDERRESERVSDFAEHSKSGSRGLLMVYDKARRGDLVITDALLEDLAEFTDKHLSGNKAEYFSLVCPEDKLQLSRLSVLDDADGLKAGEKAVVIGRITFLISFVEAKNQTPKPKPLKAKEFVLLNAGIYDKQKLYALPWVDYKPFVMQLFSLRDAPHKIKAFDAEGFIGGDSAFVWDYPNNQGMVLEENFVDSLHNVTGGQAGDRFYIIAPIVAMGFMQDEIKRGNTRYIFLKVPLSVLQRLLENNKPGALQQPSSEADVNAVIDAVGFDFISQPLVEWSCLTSTVENQDVFSLGEQEHIVRLTQFRANTLATDPEDFPNFATLSMVLVDLNYRDEVFKLAQVFWAEDLVSEELKRLRKEVSGGFEENATACEKLDIRLPKNQCGEYVMLILVDKYGNEKKITLNGVS
ncbi:site-specific DNA-methyltransferase [Methyloglobulus sp.]|uniref:site-specific DNA-methyltransferase n=1 Tax=Methyloglobulus sp. TaxID=2518622 RepID=UPI003988BBB6